MDKKNILVIEDEENILELIKETLSERYSVVKAQSGEEGMEIALSSDIDAVILDVKLPGKSGWEVIRYFRQNSKMSKVPVVFLTAVSKREREQKAQDYLVLTKPFNPEELINVVDRVIGNTHDK
jgi:DNA-binding response OmpR family regulator